MFRKIQKSKQPLSLICEATWTSWLLVLGSPGEAHALRRCGFQTSQHQHWISGQTVVEKLLKNLMPSFRLEQELFFEHYHSLPASLRWWNWLLNSRTYIELCSWEWDKLHTTPYKLILKGSLDGCPHPITPPTGEHVLLMQACPVKILPISNTAEFRKIFRTPPTPVSDRKRRNSYILEKGHVLSLSQPLIDWRKDTTNLEHLQLLQDFQEGILLKQRKNKGNDRRLEE